MRRKADPRSWRPSQRAAVAVPATVRVIVIERDRLSRIGLQRLLDGTERVAVIGAVGSVDEAESLPATIIPQVALIATSHDRDSVEDIGRLLSRFPNAKIVVLGDEEDAAVVTSAIRAGADGYLPRTISGDGLVRALVAINEGEVALPRGLLRHVVDAFRMSPPSLAAEGVIDHLSPREREVLMDVALGRTNGEIAARLGVKESTVKTHVSNILRKTGARSRFVLHASSVG